MSQHSAVRLAWLVAMVAIFLLPPGARPLAWALATLPFLALTLWGVFSIRSPHFGRAVLAGPNPSAVALTFDDGPDPSGTPALLDLLQRRGATATFFVVGASVRAAPEIVRRCAQEGHEIGNHSDRHSPLLNFRLGASMRAEIAACQRALEDTLGRGAVYYRPPIGLRNPAVHPACDRLGLRVIGWQVRSYDKSRRSPAAVALDVLRKVRPGGIVLLHDGGQSSERLLAVTAGILDGLEQRGLRSVGLSELLEPTKSPRPTSRVPSR